MVRFSTLSAAAVLLLLPVPVLGQVYSDCNPMEKDCSPNPGFGTDYDFDFSMQPSEQLWEEHVRGITYDAEKGATFTINKDGDAPTLRTNFYFFWGRTEIHLKCARGTGIISSMMWLSDDLDEVDFEMFGTKGNTSATNFFGKGVQKWTNGAEHEVAGDVRDDYHNYTTVWTAEKLDWYIDGRLVRTLLPKDADGGLHYPQTPMRMSIGIWAGGSPSLPEGTRQWAGGDTDYAEAPFHMYLKSARVTDFSSGREYVWGDRSGMANSIEIINGTSDALAAIEAGIITSADDNVQQDRGPTTGEAVTNSWNALSSTTKTAIGASIGGAFALLALVGAFFCFRQRRSGREQARLAEERYNAERAEEARLRQKGINPDSLAAQSTEYKPREMSGEKAVATATTTDNYSRADSLLRHNSWELQPQQAWDPTSGVVGAGAGAVPHLLNNDRRSGAYGSGHNSSNSVDSSHAPTPNTPRSPTARGDSPAQVGSPDSQGFEYRSRSPGPVPRSYAAPGRQFDDYSYGRL